MKRHNKNNRSKDTRQQQIRKIEDQTYWVSQVKQHPEEFEYYLKNDAMNGHTSQVIFYQNLSDNNTFYGYYQNLISVIF